MELTDQVRKRIELVSNLVIVCVAVGLGITLFINHVLRPATPSVLRPSIGARLAIGDTTTSFDKTVVIALRQDCPYCEASAPFYKELLSAGTAKGTIHFIVALPLGNDTNYPAKLGLAITDIRLVEFSALHLSATPTLVALDRDGRVTNVWVGELSSKGQSEVLRTLGLNG